MGSRRRKRSERRRERVTARYRRETTRASKTVRSWQPTSERKVNEEERRAAQMSRYTWPGLANKWDNCTTSCQHVGRYAALSFLFKQFQTIPTSHDHTWMAASWSHIPAEMDCAEPLFPANSLPKTHTTELNKAVWLQGTIPSPLRCFARLCLGHTADKGSPALWAFVVSD
ncbi:hypothetical protein M441DRAFT_337886 [Trichoderma asperellum CBS 433.97]|uniref:Uncharacterized protein n=1 Tax=Trichoderma asperellum (strain ATCC 204424 / CBS 433.97 / NBRC 101777) TaxID=1042311 RepID=A0A2T3ZGL7_TRIA4|nr:hypothetical protein M441DRAFT_337886 [Trichoderma asperellum CBS 433.97]PTB43952.1 hypothetical protein M441DRAFT_337886 [Trichoderma asperellum CBS 433.97]